MQVFSVNNTDKDSSGQDSLLARFSVRTASLSDDGDRERYIAFIAPDESALKNKELQFPEYAVRECTNHKILPERLLFILLEKIISSDIALMRGIDEAESNIEEKLLADEKLE